MKPVNIFRLTHEVEYTYSDYEIRFYYFDKPEWKRLNLAFRGEIK